MTSCVWLLSLNVMFSRFIHTVMFIRTYSSPRLNNIQLYMYSTSSSAVCQLIDIPVVSTFWLLWTILLWTYACKFLCGPMFSFLMGIYLGVNAGSYRNSILSFLRNCQPVFCKVTAPFYIPTNNVWRFQFFYFLINTCYCLSFWPSHPSGSEVVSQFGCDCISLVSDGAEHLFIC